MNYELIKKELIAREPVFHHPNKYGTSREDIEAQMCDDFSSIVASGKKYKKEDVIEILLKRYVDPDYEDNWEVKEFDLIKIAKDNYLVTYILVHNGKATRRSTIWRLEEEKWKILYHQGTNPAIDILSK